MTLKFYKELDRWYVVIEGYERPQCDMLLGADTLLSNLTTENSIELDVNIEDFDAVTDMNEPNKLFRVCLTPDIGGAMYYVESIRGHKFGYCIWLCDLTKNLLDKMPDIISIV